MTDRQEKLGIVVEATDRASGKLSGVKREVAGIGTAAQTAGTRFGGATSRVESGASRMKGAIGGAVSHAKTQFASLASSAGALLGIGGIFGGFTLITKSIEEAASFGRNVQLVARSTGLALPVASAMVDTLDKWGVSSDRLIPMLGKMEKNLGAIVAKKGGLADFKKQFGVALTDSNHHLLNANQLLLKSADYFNSNASATQKALFLSKLWGKNWQDMIPILSKGSGFIKAQEKDAIHLTQAQLDNITKFQNARREFQDSWGDLEVKIGANIMPLLTRGMAAVSSWVDAHGDEVATFFGQAGDTVGTAVGGIVGVFGAIKAGWETIPGPVRDLLIKGFAADKAVKFVFGFDPIKTGISALFGGGIKGLFQRGGSPANPMWVASVGGAGGLPGGGGTGLLGKLGIGLAVVGAGVAIAEAIKTQQDVSNATSAQAAGIHKTLDTSLATSPGMADLQKKLGAIDAGITKIQSNPLMVLVQGSALDELQSMRQEVVAAIYKQDTAKSVKAAIATTRTPDGRAADARESRHIALLSRIASKKTTVKVDVRSPVSVEAEFDARFAGASRPVSVRRTVAVAPTTHSAGTVVALAGGGRYRAGMPRLTGEHGPELDIPDSGGSVVNANETRDLLRGLRNAESHVTNATALAAIAAAMDRFAARPVYALASSRDFEATAARRGSHGSRARQIGW